MTRSIFSHFSNSSMVKDEVADALREQIISGGLHPGAPIVEGKWAKKLNVAQASVREAINILTFEGFVEKGSGRSARVTLLDDEDVAQIYQVRGALESLAAGLVAEKRTDVSELEQLIADMGAAASRNNVRGFYERDLQFHMLICRKAENRYLEEELRRLIVPLFAFVIMRIHGSASDRDHLKKSIEQHRHILESIRSGDPFFAEQQVRRTIRQFAGGTYDLLQAERRAAGT